LQVSTTLIETPTYTAQVTGVATQQKQNQNSCETLSTARETYAAQAIGVVVSRS